MPKPIAQWNPARSAWETDEVSLCGHSDVFSETWPSSGMTRAGRAYALPTWERRTDGSASSSSPGTLPTPTSTDHKASGATYAPTDTHHQGTTLTDATVRQADTFGQYEPAIARWEAVLRRPAPAPTEPTGKGGAHRLSPRFVEWMMGLPDGWVTDTDTSRNEQLKALGNGVVPQQASAALRHMLTLKGAS